MIDYFAIGLSHALLLLAALRLIGRGDLDRDPPADPPAKPHANPLSAAARKGVGDA